MPDRARTDPAIGTVEMREGLFLALVHIAESIIGGPPWHNWKLTIPQRIKPLFSHFGEAINSDLVKQLVHETLVNGGVASEDKGSVKGGSDGRR